MLSAFACHPDHGSEPGSGWHWALQASRFHQVHVLTAAYNEPAIELALARDPRPNLRFAYHEIPRRVEALARGPGHLHLKALAWEATALPVARRLHDAVGFDVVHHVTYHSVETPGSLYRLGVPFIWGPAGGAQRAPHQLRSYYGRHWPVEWLRGLRKRAAIRHPSLRRAARNSVVTIAANGDAERFFRQLGSPRVIRELEIGIDAPSQMPDVARRQPGELALLWAGEFIPRKAPDLALDVMLELRRRGTAARLVMMGGGPLHKGIAQRVAAENLSNIVELGGRVPHAEMRSRYAAADAFLFTSLQDTTGTVILEAMAHALPVIALDHHGAAQVITEGSGIKIPVADPRSVVRSFGDAVAELVDDDSRLDALRRGAYERARGDLSWDHKGEFLRVLYQEVSDRRSDGQLSPDAGRIVPSV